MLRFVFDTLVRLRLLIIPKNKNFEFVKMAKVIEVSDINHKSVQVIEPDVLQNISSYFDDYKRVGNLVKVSFLYKVRFQVGSKKFSFRVTQNGMILEDVPGSQVQDGYIPSKPGITDLLSIILS